jgi:hypothetical protein
MVRGTRGPKERKEETMKKTIEMLKNENYYITLYDLIENKLEEIRKANGWKNLNGDRYEKAMEKVAEDLGADAEDLKAYYED